MGIETPLGTIETIQGAPPDGVWMCRLRGWSRDLFAPFAVSGCKCSRKSVNGELDGTQTISVECIAEYLPFPHIAPLEAKPELPEWPVLARWLDDEEVVYAVRNEPDMRGYEWALCNGGQNRTDEDIPADAERIDINTLIARVAELEGRLSDNVNQLESQLEDFVATDSKECLILKEANRNLRETVATLTADNARLTREVAEFQQQRDEAEKRIAVLEASNGFTLAAQRRDERDELARQLAVATAERDGLSNALNDVALGYTAAIKKFGLELKQKGVVA